MSLLPRKRARRIAGAFVCALLATSSVAISSLPSAAATAAPGTRKTMDKKPSKVAHVVQEAVNDVADARGRGRSPARASNSLMRATADGRLEVTVHSRLPVAASQRAALRALGAEVTAALDNPAGLDLPDAGVVQVLLPHSRIDDAARLPWVVAITPPGYAEPDTHPTNPINSQGVAFHNADDVQTRGVDGTGVTVGVVSDGVENLAASQAQNELPAVTVLDAGNNDEGTAMLEIVHDMAPGAGLMFDGTGGGTVNHVNSLNNLVANGADVITEDIPFDAEPAFQQGLVAQAGENIATAGVPIHSSAGNQAGRHAARVTATGTGGGPDGAAGPFTGCSYDPDNVVAIAPGGDTTFDVTLGNNANFTLQWSEPRAIFPTAGQGGFTDLDLFVMNAGLTQCLGQSTNLQANGVGDTIEQVAVGGMNGQNAKIVVEVQGTSSAVAAPIIDLRWRRAGAVDNSTRAGSLNPDSNYTGLATSAAALDAQNAGALEGFSSGGPVQLITTTQCPGGAAGPCTGAAGASATSGAPTWSAADNVSVSGVGGFGSPFTGTSAAAPHAAGCDALLRSELGNANALPANTNALLAASAIDIDSAGTDNNTGAGQLDCLQAVNDPPTADAGGPYNTVEGTNVQLDATGSTDPDAGDSITYEWDLDDDGQFDDSTAAKPTFDLVGQDGLFTVSVRATDTAGDTDTDSSTVDVDNVAPTAAAISTNAPKDEETAVSISGLVKDPGWLDPLTATIDFGDGAGAQPLAGVVENVRPDATFSYATTHLYGDNGTFTIEVCAADDDTSGNCTSTVVKIDNINPKAAIDTTGTTLINGIPTFLAHAGETLTFSGRSTDPGSDDLALSWDWDDGAPAPDELTNYLVNPPALDPPNSPSVQPRDVTDTKPHAFGDACLYAITFASADDDAGSDDDSAKVIITGNAGRNRSPGYWGHQYKGQGSVDFTTAQLNCYLAIAGFMSTVFNEVVDASTIGRAYRVLEPGNPMTIKQQFDRHLLAAWLNFANGGIDLTDPVDTDGDGANDSTFAATVVAAEIARLDPTTTKAQFEAHKNKLERINLRDG